MPTRKTHRGKHSLVRRVRRYVRGLILDNAFHDRRKAEKINVTTQAIIAKAISDRFGVVPMSCVPDVELGEVLLDSRGEGILQQKELPNLRRIG